MWKGSSSTIAGEPRLGDRSSQSSLGCACGDASCNVNRRHGGARARLLGQHGPFAGRGQLLEDAQSTRWAFGANRFEWTAMRTRTHTVSPFNLFARKLSFEARHAVSAPGDRPTRS